MDKRSEQWRMIAGNLALTQVGWRVANTLLCEMTLSSIYRYSYMYGATLQVTSSHCLLLVFSCKSLAQAYYKLLVLAFRSESRRLVL